MVWDGSVKGFECRGDKFIIKHMLFNLIKNALRAIKEVDKGKIYITLKTDKEFNYLFFKDTALGVSEEKIASIFQQFGDGSEDGTGLGLAFCKTTMLSYGGDITCNSKEGEYTEFVLTFPKVNKKIMS